MKLQKSITSPVWRRFQLGGRDNARVLVICAPPGTGRHLLAASWLGYDDGQVLDWSAQPAETVIEEILDLLDTEYSERFAIVIPAHANLARIALHSDCLIAGLADLLLTQQEIELFLEETSGTSRTTMAKELYEATGGWLGLVLPLKHDPGTTDAAVERMAIHLRTLMATCPSYETLTEAAFLPRFTAETLHEFYGPILGTYQHEAPVGVERKRLPTLDRLFEAGLLRRTGPDWWMPTLVRQAIISAVKRDEPEKLRELQSRAALATAAVIPEEAAEEAVKNGLWSSLSEILYLYWPSVFSHQPELLKKWVASAPYHWLTHSMDLDPAAQIVKSMGPAGFNLRLPSAATLVQAPPRSYRKPRRNGVANRPNVRILLVESSNMALLRVRGHFIEAARRATDLRISLLNMQDRWSTATFKSIAALQCGISLQIGGEPLLARECYGDASFWSREDGYSFVIANAEANLALIEVLDGNTSLARAHLKRHAGAIQDVGWGKEMVSRAAVIARGLVAIDELDEEGVALQLDKLPPQPDNDEFWSAHVFLLCLQKTYFGSPISAYDLANEFELGRKVAAQSPLAQQLINRAKELALAAAGRRMPTPSSPPSNDPNIALGQAWRYAMAGNHASAIAICDEIVWGDTVGSRPRHVAQNLKLVLSSMQGESMREGIPPAYDADGELRDLLPLWSNPLLRKTLTRKAGLTHLQVDRLNRYAPEKIPNLSDNTVLTAREVQVLQGLYMGKSRADLARDAFVSVHTIKAQTTSLYRKLGVNSRDEAVSVGISLGYF